MKLEDFVQDRDLVIFDLETTGTSVQKDRIVQFAGVKVFADGRERETLESLVNPEMKIPPDASDVHKITDAMVAKAPKFREFAPRIAAFLEGADLGGYNILSYDLPLLRNEFQRVGATLAMRDRRIIDGMLIFKLYERRDLEAALRFYCNAEHPAAHDALGDVKATIDVIQAQLERYDSLPKNMDELSRKLFGRRLTSDGRLIWQDGTPCIGFGKHNGVPLQTMVAQHRGYLEWILGSDFPDDVKDILRKALAGTFPEPS